MTKYDIVILCVTLLIVVPLFLYCRHITHIKEKESEIQAQWEPSSIPGQDITQCSRCGFGFFPSQTVFLYGECISASPKAFYPTYCPNCGRKIQNATVYVWEDDGINGVIQTEDDLLRYQGTKMTP